MDCKSTLEPRDWKSESMPSRPPLKSSLFFAFFAPFCGYFLLGTAWPQGYAPEVAASKMKVPGGFVVKLVASEPEVRQPILVKFDDRGRLWTIQYLQYPNPAGLKRVKVDRWSRTVYDRIPEPPPRGPRRPDPIPICEATAAHAKP